VKTGVLDRGQFHTGGLWKKGGRIGETKREKGRRGEMGKGWRKVARGMWGEGNCEGGGRVWAGEDGMGGGKGDGGG